MHPLLDISPVRTVRPLDLSEQYPKIGKLWFRSLTLEEKVRFELGNRHKHNSPEWAEAEVTRAAELLVKVLCNEQGDLLFTALDVIKLQKQDAQLMSILFEVACRWSGLTLSQSIFAAIEAAEKKSNQTGS